jgi:hypothetical protein
MRIKIEKNCVTTVFTQSTFVEMKFKKKILIKQIIVNFWIINKTDSVSKPNPEFDR